MTWPVVLAGGLTPASSGGREAFVRAGVILQNRRPAATQC